MAHNRYFAVDANDENINEIIGVCVGSLEQQRYSVDLTKIIVKLCEGDHHDYSFLDKYQELDHDQAYDLMQTPEWQESIGPNQEDD